MKASLMALFLGIQALSSVMAEECAFRVQVVDESNQPITNATVWAQFEHYSGITPVIDKDVREPTGTNGIWSYQGASRGTVGLEASKTGFYRSFGGTLHFTNAPLRGRLEPWNELHVIQLREVINPIAMYARRTGSQIPPPKIPEFGKPVGFDLIKSDWVAPYGKGETPDFIFSIKSDDSAIPKEYYEKHPRSFRYKDTEAHMSFANDGDGLQCVLDDPRNNGSVFRLPRYAPESGYESNLVRVTRVFYIPPRNGTYEGDIVSQGDAEQGRPDQNYIIRVRSQRDQNGAITNALYGKIRGPIGLNSGGFVSFTYYLNPTPNDRNLEYDASRNLLKDVLGYRENPPPGP